MADKIVTYRQSKLGQTNFTPSHRVGVIFTYNVDTSTDYDEQDPNFLGGNFASQASQNTVKNPVGTKQKGKASGEILVGAGIRSVNIEQQINVTQEGSLGWFDIAETISHNVSGNTFTIEKMALRLNLLANNGVAPWGKDVITSPRLNAYILDSKERQRGVDIGFVKLMGLHINTNRLTANVGTPMMENVTFRADRILRVKRIPTALLSEMKKQFGSIYSGIETLDEYTIVDGS